MKRIYTQTGRSDAGNERGLYVEGSAMGVGFSIIHRELGLQVHMAYWLTTEEAEALVQALEAHLRDRQ